MDDRDVDGISAEIEEVRGGVMDRAVEDFRPKREDSRLHRYARIDLWGIRRSGSREGAAVHFAIGRERESFDETELAGNHVGWQAVG